jgi:5-methylcytosine-specific restriction endonuclease McrA
MKCLICPSPADEAHHFVPRSRGGVYTVPLCHGCHRKVTENRQTQVYLLKRKLRAAGCDLDDVRYLFNVEVQH